MCRKARFGLLLGGLLGAAVRMMLVVGLIGASVAMAQQKVDNNAVFELDGDAFCNKGGGGTDWDCDTGKVFDTDPPNATIFTQGGSKDGNGINQWRQTSGSVPDKDDIRHAYAVSKLVSGETLVYFGADRFANNGDANIGFWFFQNTVGLGPNGTFSGHHKNGDIFAVSGFTSGGQTTEIDVYKWICSGTGLACDTSGSLQLISSTVGGTNATCTPGAGTHTACAIGNTTAQPAPWPYTPKSGTPGTFPVATFFEGGINVGALGIPANTCFSTFMVETRSSTSLTAQLKDFVLGAFQSCGIEITKTCSDSPTINAAGTKLIYKFGGQVKNVGGGTLTNVIVTDVFSGANFGNPSPSTGNASCSGNTCTYNLGSLTAGQCKSWPNANVITCGATLTDADKGTFESTDNGGQLDSASVAADSGSGTSGDVTAGPASPDCGSNTDVPTLTVSKNCTTTLSSSLASSPVTVNFDGDVCNQSPYLVTGVTATDIQVDTDTGNTTILNPAGTVTFAGASPVNLAPCPTPGSCNITDNGTSCRHFTGSYTPSTVSGGTNACTFTFRDKVTATGSIFTGATVTGSGGATCPLCGCK